MQSEQITELKNTSDRIYGESVKLQRIIDDIVGTDAQRSITDAMMNVAKEMCEVVFPDQVSTDDEIVHSLTVRNKTRAKYNMLLDAFIRSHIKTYFGIDDIDRIDAHFQLLMKTSVVKLWQEKHAAVVRKLDELVIIRDEQAAEIESLKNENRKLKEAAEMVNCSKLYKKNHELEKTIEEIECVHDAATHRMQMTIENRDKHIAQLKEMISIMASGTSFNEESFWKSQMEHFIKSKKL